MDLVIGPIRTKLLGQCLRCKHFWEKRLKHITERRSNFCWRTSELFPVAPFIHTENIHEIVHFTPDFVKHVFIDLWYSLFFAKCIFLLQFANSNIRLI